MRISRNFLLLGAWTLSGLFLIWLLFALSSVSLSDAIAAFRSTPLWMFAAVIALTFVYLVLGTLKWRVAARNLSEPTRDPGSLRLLELTTLGEFFGQIIPTQVSMLLVRWFLMDRDNRASGYAVRATFFEQVFDLLLLICGSLATIAYFILDISAVRLLVVFFCFLAIGFILLRPIFRLATNVFGILAELRTFSRFSRTVYDGLKKISSAPRGVMLLLCNYSLARLAVAVARAVLVIWFFVPSVSGWLIFFASPAIGLLVALPISPAGLGVAEWSWSAVLIMGGAAAPAAAIAALSLRLVNLVSLSVLVLMTTLARKWRDQHHTASGQADD